MQWFKHRTDARHDPFVWDLRKRFGGDGYFVYFATLEIYADSYKPAAGWFLDVSIDYLKYELSIYHAKRLLIIMDYIRSWPDVDGQSTQPIGGNKSDVYVAAPKWVAQISRDRIALLIPSFPKIMDNYTKQKVRKMDDQPVAGDIQNNGTEIVSIFRDIARDCEQLQKLSNGSGGPFPAIEFVGWCVKNNIHPRAIRDATAALISQVKRWDDIKDKWAYARGVVKTRASHYSNEAVDSVQVQAIFGGFFNAEQRARGESARASRH